ncbi:MAG: tail fiber protein [Phycisphaerales bacterium]|nr:tail fiber protein [Phycisphaerales bacterium]
MCNNDEPTGQPDKNASESGDGAGHAPAGARGAGSSCMANQAGHCGCCCDLQQRRYFEDRVERLKTFMQVAMGVAAVVLSVPMLASLFTLMSTRDGLMDVKERGSDIIQQLRRDAAEQLQQMENDRRGFAESVSIASSLRKELDAVKADTATAQAQLSTAIAKSEEMARSANEARERLQQVSDKTADAEFVAKALEQLERGIGQVRSSVSEAAIGAVAPPIGSVVAFAGGEIEARKYVDRGWIVCDGRVVSKAEYPELFQVIGNTYGGSGAMFGVPDYRGLFLRGLGKGSGMLGEIQADQIAQHSHPHLHYVARDAESVGELSNSTTLSRGGRNGADSKYTLAPVAGEADIGRTSTSDASRITGTLVGPETRPRNAAVVYLMRAKPLNPTNP